LIIEPPKQIAKNTQDIKQIILQIAGNWTDRISNYYSQGSDDPYWTFKRDADNLTTLLDIQEWLKSAVDNLSKIRSDETRRRNPSYDFTTAAAFDKAIMEFEQLILQIQEMSEVSADMEANSKQIAVQEEKMPVEDVSTTDTSGVEDRTSSSGTVIHDNISQLIEDGQFNFDKGSENIKVVMNRLKDLNRDEYKIAREAFIEVLQNEEANIHVREMAAYELRLFADKQVIDILMTVAKSDEAQDAIPAPVDSSVPEPIRGKSLSRIADYSLQCILAEESQAVIVYSDALMDSKALQETLSRVNKGNRRYYLVNKSGMGDKELLQKLGLAEGIFDRVFKETSPEIAVEKILSALNSEGILQVRVVALEDKDSQAWSKRKNIIDILLVILSSKEFDVMTPDERNRALYEESIQHAVILQQA